MISQEELEELYKYMGIHRISEKTGESYDSIRDAMNLYGIKPNKVKIREHKNDKKVVSVRKVDIYNLYPIEFNEELKNKIRMLYDNKCYICGIDKNNDRSLDVHHIDSNPKNNDESNLIPVCRSCHSKITLFNRYKKF